MLASLDDTGLPKWSLLSKPRSRSLFRRKQLKMAEQFAPLPLSVVTVIPSAAWMTENLFMIKNIQTSFADKCSLKAARSTG